MVVHLRFGRGEGARRDQELLGGGRRTVARQLTAVRARHT